MEDSDDKVIILDLTVKEYNFLLAVLQDSIANWNTIAKEHSETGMSLLATGMATDIDIFMGRILDCDRRKDNEDE